jgi:hypothetical protein
MTKDTCLPQDSETAQSLQSLLIQKIPRTARSLRITHSHARVNTIKIRKQYTNHFEQEQKLH